MLTEESEKCGAIPLLQPENLTADHFGITLDCMGAPTAFVEKLPNASAMIASMDRVEKELGRKFNCVVPLEAGGINATIPLVVGGWLGLSVVNADGMGCVFPEFQMTSFNIYGAECKWMVQRSAKPASLIRFRWPPKLARRSARRAALAWRTFVRQWCVISKLPIHHILPVF